MPQVSKMRYGFNVVSNCGVKVSPWHVMRLGRNVVRVKNGVATNFPDAYAFNVAADNGWLLMRIPQDETNANTGIPPAANNSDGTMPKPGEGIGLTDGVIN